jgi:hypothetical protein
MQWVEVPIPGRKTGKMAMKSWPADLCKEDQ